MKVDPSTLDYIQAVVRTAELAKIDKIIIEPGKVRAIDSDNSVIIMHDKNVPELEFGSIGLNRIDVFSSRFELIKGVQDFNLDAVVYTPDDGSTPFARALTMKGKGIKIDYRCAHPQTIKVPKALNDTIKYRVRMTPEAVHIMQRGATAMGSTEVMFKGTEEGVELEISDINSDTLTYKFAATAEDVDDSGDPANFTHKYLIKTILPLFKSNPDGHFFFTSRGMMKVIVNGLDVYVLPRT